MVRFDKITNTTHSIHFRLIFQTSVLTLTALFLCSHTHSGGSHEFATTVPGEHGSGSIGSLLARHRSSLPLVAAAVSPRLLLLPVLPPAICGDFRMPHLSNRVVEWALLLLLFPLPEPADLLWCRFA
jgi:hypothetical protein